MVASKSVRAEVAEIQHKYDHSILVLQGGGALGAYQAGVYDGLAESGIKLDWVTGVSIGAINAALIAGNPPERRVERLAEFWDLVSSASPMIPPASFDLLRPSLNRVPMCQRRWACPPSLRRGCRLPTSLRTEASTL